MVKTNKKKLAVIGVIAALAVIGTGVTIHATCPRRAIKKVLCTESPEMCRCYSNIVDYRMTNREVAITKRFQNEIKEFGLVSALEFASPEEVQHLNALLTICQMEQAQRYAQRQQAVAPAQQVPVQQQAPIQQQVPAQQAQPARQPAKK